MRDFRKLSGSGVVLGQNTLTKNNSGNNSLSKTSQREDNSPLSNALFLHFLKWNPEIVSKEDIHRLAHNSNQGELNEGAGRI